VWVLTWTLRSSATAKALTHRSHWYRFSVVWVLIIWSFTQHFFLKSLSQMEQLNVSVFCVLADVFISLPEISVLKYMAHNTRKLHFNLFTSKPISLNQLETAMIQYNMLLYTYCVTRNSIGQFGSCDWTIKMILHSIKMILCCSTISFLFISPHPVSLWNEHVAQTSLWNKHVTQTSRGCSNNSFASCNIIFLRAISFFLVQ